MNLTLKWLSMGQIQFWNVFNLFHIIFGFLKLFANTYKVKRFHIKFWIRSLSWKSWSSIRMCQLFTDPVLLHSLALYLVHLSCWLMGAKCSVGVKTVSSGAKQDGYRFWLPHITNCVMIGKLLHLSIPQCCLW